MKVDILISINHCAFSKILAISKYFCIDSDSAVLINYHGVWELMSSLVYESQVHDR